MEFQIRVWKQDFFFLMYFFRNVAKNRCKMREDKMLLKFGEKKKKMARRIPNLA